jgi:uncharacterized protein (TIGR02300 family)
MAATQRGRLQPFEDWMATKADRGTKRTCQNAECAVRFYDLARDPVICPTCGAVYQIIVSPPAVERRSGRRPTFAAPVPPEPNTEDALGHEASDEVTADAPGDDTLPEEDDDDADPADFAVEPEKEDG